MNLTINPSTTSTSSATSCDTYTWNGTVYTSSGTYTYSTTNSNGCDSTATLNLTINNSVTSTNNQTVCYGGSYTIGSSTYTTSGAYTDVFTAANGCDSSVTTILVVSPEITSTNNQTVCYGGSYAINGNTYTSTGTYTDVFTAANGCDSTVTTNLTILPQFNVSIQAAGSSTACSGSGVLLSMTTFASAANTYQWSDANGVISGATSSTYTATSTGTYSLTVTTPAGCTTTSNAVAVSIITVSTPTGMYASNLQLNKGTMNWSAVTNANHYDIRFRAQGSATWTTLMLNILTTSKQKSGLTSSTTYEWQVRSACSTDSSSVSAWSSTENFTTLTPCTTPVNATVTGITLTSATLGWDAVSGAWGYKVRYKATSQGYSAWVYDNSHYKFIFFNRFIHCYGLSLAGSNYV